MCATVSRRQRAEPDARAEPRGRIAPPRSRRGPRRSQSRRSPFIAQSHLPTQNRRKMCVEHIVGRSAPGDLLERRRARPAGRRARTPPAATRRPARVHAARGDSASCAPSQQSDVTHVGDRRRVVQHISTSSAVHAMPRAVRRGPRRSSPTLTTCLGGRRQRCSTSALLRRRSARLYPAVRRDQLARSSRRRGCRTIETTQDDVGHRLRLARSRHAFGLDRVAVSAAGPPCRPA